VLTALELTVQRHEVTFGAIEENESRRRQDQQAVLNAEGVRAVYANFGRVTGTAEELIIDIGLNPEPFSEPPVECKISHRPIMDFYAAKQLAAEISRVVQEHERSEGTIEVDPKLRMKAGKPGRW